ncbi:ROK family glucokinase [Marinilactibacillus sp. Marseille-P9653]|uniref:ROK family glucokinase n=1 Tax=Marinilactibacillus sp. Marseille-P9653 TaxID=2866583 RepID=UPI001CE3E0F4|nr:ROK family glucokinase [Marinilactibacillus sp. Marseille-P9653]
MREIAIGIDLGGTSIKFAFLTREGEIIKQWAIPTPVDSDGRLIIPFIIRSIKENIEESTLLPAQIVAIGMGSPGSVNREKGTVIGAFNLNWIKTVYVKEQMEEAFQIPFILDNDANVAALGEQWLGAGQNDPNVVFLTLGTGVGGGVIVKGELVHGFLDTAGEIGHLKVENEGFTCTCGQVGCLETVASATGIVAVAKKEARGYMDSSVLAKTILDGRVITSKSIFESAKLKDPFAEHVLSIVGRYLGVACANIANVLNPSTIILGGGVSKAGNLLLSYVVPNFERNAFPTIAKRTAIKIATLENDAGVLGAASLAFESADKT